MPDPITSARRDRDYSSSEDCDDKTGVCGATAKTPDPKASRSSCDEVDFHTPCLLPLYGGVSAREVAKNMAPPTAPKNDPVASTVTNASQTPENELAQVNARLARPADYAGRGGDEQRKSELEKSTSNVAQKTATPGRECLPWEACQDKPVPQGESSWSGPSGTASASKYEVTVHGSVISHGPDLEVGFVEHKEGIQTELTVGGGQRTMRGEAFGVKGKMTVQAVTVHDGIGVLNPDGSVGLNASSYVSVGNSEQTLTAKNNSLTVGLGVGAGGEFSIGVRKSPGEPDASCARVAAGPITLGLCLAPAHPNEDR